MRRHLVGGDGGSASVELVLLTPVLIGMLVFVVALGRIASARQDVDAAARDAARAAANARSTSRANIDGNEAARRALLEGGVNCRALTVVVDTTAFRPGGLVAASVSCTVDLSDLSGIRLPGNRVIKATFAAPIDQYRGVS